MAKGDLTGKQQAFVREYLVDFNATGAAKRAGYKHPDIGRRIINSPRVSAVIQQARQECQERLILDQMYVINKLREIAETPASDGPDSELRVSNKLKALELLGKHLGAFDGKQSGSEEVRIIDDL